MLPLKYGQADSLSMKVLAISGSPRRDGNTDDALKATLDELEGRIQGLDAEFLRITDYRIEHCRGCRHCMTHVECVIRDDDLDLLVGKMHDADLVILGAPVYWWGPPGVFKDFIDRTHGFYPDDTRFQGKKVAVVTVAAQSGFPSHEKTMSWLEHYGAEYVGWLRLFAREKGELKMKPKQLKKLEAFALEIANP
ncbi:flavodoxin family protein [Candidatus Bathyarchaeota archaeon]|nr:MAG: flavodoxin family protein [Candidatus Bathyarchaeota archaeon]